MFKTQKKNNLEGEISAMLNLGNKRRPSFYSCRPSFYSWRPSFYSFKHSMMRSTGPEKYSFEVFQKNQVLKPDGFKFKNLEFGIHMHQEVYTVNDVARQNVLIKWVKLK